MMKKRLAVLLSLALILTLCGTFAGALASEVENGIDAIEDAMMKGNTNTSSFFDGMDDLREGTSADTVPTPDDFPSKYNYGSGKIQDYSRDNMLRRLSEPEGNATVLNTAADPEHIQALFLWEEDNVPTKTRFTENMTGYFDSWNFRPYVTAIPVRTGVQPKGAVVLMAGGAYQFRGNYTDSLPTAAALRELGFQTFIVDYRLSPYTQEEGALDVARAVRFVRKNASVYYVGNGYAVEWRGFSYGSVRTKVKDRKWKYWYKLPFIQYREADAEIPAPEIALGSRLLKRGMVGSDVKALQELLMQLGYALPKHGADAEFGSETEKALLAFQKKAGLEADGKYGDKTHAALMDAVADDDGQPDMPEQPAPNEPAPAGTTVVIVSEGGKVNVRCGNGTEYERLSTVAPGSTFPLVATAQNDWHAIVIGSRVGWVSGKFAKII